MDISRDDQRAAMRQTIHDMLTPAWLRWTLAVAVTATFALVAAGLLAPSPGLARAVGVGTAATLLLCGYWLARAALVERYAKREPREVSVRAAALAMRRAGVEEELRQVRVAMVGGPWDGDVVPLLLPGSGLWPDSMCPQVDGVRQHYRLERVGGGTEATYAYVGECTVGGVDG